MLEKITIWSGRMMARLYASMLLKMDVQWRAPLPAGPKIIAVNHPTTTDPFLMMGWASEPLHILITEMCFKMPALGRFLRQAGHVPVADGNGRAALEQAVKLLQAGRSVAIFPEGALSPLEGGVCPAHTGVARLALITGAPVIPVGICLRRENIYFRKTTVDGKTEIARWYLHGPYAVTVGEPIRFKGSVEDRELVRSVSQHIMQRISLLARESAQRIRTSQALASRAARPAPLGQALASLFPYGLKPALKRISDRYRRGMLEVTRLAARSSQNLVQTVKGWLFKRELESADMAYAYGWFLS